MKVLSVVFEDPVLRRLGKVAAVVGLLGIGSALYFQSKIRSNLLNTPYIKDSLKIFKDHQDVVAFLGQPIGIGKIDLGSKNNFITNSEAHFEVPITGKKHVGLLHLWAARQSQASDWRVDRVEVSVDDRPGKRILVYRVAEQEEQGQTASIT